MNDSILLSVKDYLGVNEDTTAFDNTLIMLINTAFVSLNDIGGGPSDPIVIEDASDTWDSIEGSGVDQIKTYICMKTQLLFDPPQTHVVMDALKNAVSEVEWRIRTRVENMREEES